MLGAEKSLLFRKCLSAIPTRTPHLNLESWLIMHQHQAVTLLLELINML